MARASTAASLLVTVGDNPERLRSVAAWAHLCGVALIEASSGKITRHRLNRGSDRYANQAPGRIVTTRLAGIPAPVRIWSGAFVRTSPSFQRRVVRFVLPLPGKCR